MLHVISKIEVSDFIEEIDTDVFKFSHDKIRESTLTLNFASKNDDVVWSHLKIGRNLYAWLESDELNHLKEDGEIATIVAQQINHDISQIRDRDELTKMASLNFRVSKIKINKSAFYQAKQFLEVAAKLLEEAVTSWDDDTTDNNVTEICSICLEVLKALLDNN